MSKIFAISIQEVKNIKKVLIPTLVTIVIILISATLTSKRNENIFIFILMLSSMLDKLLIPLFAYIGFKNYKTSLKNYIQSGVTRREFTLARLLMIAILATITGIISTSAAYYLVSIETQIYDPFIFNFYIGIYTPFITTLYGYENIFMVTIITISFYNFIGNIGFITASFINKVGGIHSFIIFIFTSFIINFIVNQRRLKNSKIIKPEIMDVLLGFSGVHVNLITPIVTFTTMSFIVSLVNYFIVTNTEV